MEFSPRPTSTPARTPRAVFGEGLGPASDRERIVTAARAQRVQARFQAQRALQLRLVERIQTVAAQRLVGDFARGIDACLIRFARGGEQFIDVEFVD